MEYQPFSSPLHAIRRSTPLFLARLLGAEAMIEVVYLVWMWHIDFAGYTDAIRMELHSASSMIYTGMTVFQFFLFVFMSMRWYADYYVILPAEILYRKGLYHRKEYLYPFASIQSMAVYRSFRGRIFNYGTVNLIMPAFGRDARLYEMPQPEQFVELVRRAMEQRHTAPNGAPGQGQIWMVPGASPTDTLADG